MWRTEIRNDYDSDDWYPVGPAYPTAQAGLAQADDLLAFHFGGHPARAELAGRIARDQITRTARTAAGLAPLHPPHPGNQAGGQPPVES